MSEPDAAARAFEDCCGVRYFDRSIVGTAGTLGLLLAFVLRCTLTMLARPRSAVCAGTGFATASLKTCDATLSRSSDGAILGAMLRAMLRLSIVLAPSSVKPEYVESRKSPGMK